MYLISRHGRKFQIEKCLRDTLVLGIFVRTRARDLRIPRGSPHDLGYWRISLCNASLP